MKYFFIFFLLFLFKLVPAQTNHSGEYKLSTSGDIRNIAQGTILKLNCNNTFVQEDSVIVSYGKWSIKDNNRLVMQFDSISVKNKTRIDQTTILYTIQDGRIFRTKIPRKEYTEFKRSFERSGVLRFMSFSAYEEMELKRYYQRIAAYSCK